MAEKLSLYQKKTTNFKRGKNTRGTALGRGGNFRRNTPEGARQRNENGMTTVAEIMASQETPEKAAEEFVNFHNARAGSLEEMNWNKHRVYFHFKTWNIYGFLMKFNLI